MIESVYVACECSEEVFEELLGYKIVLGTCESFVMLEDEYSELLPCIRNKIVVEPLYLEL